jgi:hypothetical protein
MEAFVVGHIRGIGRDTAKLAQAACAPGLEDTNAAGASDRERLDEESRAALTAFDLAWPTLAPPEQALAVGLLVRRVDYHGGKGTVAITFDPAGLRTLAGEQTIEAKEQTT